MSKSRWERPLKQKKYRRQSYERETQAETKAAINKAHDRIVGKLSKGFQVR